LLLHLHVSHAVAAAQPPRFLVSMGAIALVVMACGVVAAWLLSRHITGPISELTQAAGDIARGTYARRVSVRRLDELGSLAASFNTMAERVSVREGELAAANEALRESRTRFERLIESAHEGICTLDANGRITYANPRLGEMLGCETSVLAGRALFEFMDDETAFEARTRFARRLLGIAETHELALRRSSDGTAIWVHLSESSLVDAKGEFAGAIWMVSDISARREAEVRLRSSERHFRALIENASDMICIIDAAGRFAYVSPAQERFIGWRPDDMVGRTPLEFIHAEDVAAVAETLATVQATPGATVSASFRHRHADGSWRYITAAATNLLDDPDVRGIVVNSHDLTAQHALQAQLLQAQKMEAVGQLAGGIAHDFNNLLTLIQGHTSLLRSSLPAGDRHLEDVEVIADAAERAAALTQRLMTFSRRAVVAPKVVEINDVVRESEQILRRLIGEDLQLAVRLDPAAGRVRADGAHLGQVIMNLALNARDAMPSGGLLTLATSSLVVDAESAAALERPAGRYTRLRVEDTGIGMTPEVRAHVFEPFFTTKEVGKGTGLGMAVVHGIVTQCDGYIEIDSEVGRGTAVTVDLPTVEDAPGEEPRPVPGRASGSETILLVEDEEGVRSLMARTLEKQGFDVLTAANGAEALRLAERHTRAPDLLVTDVVMPGMTGRELADTLRERHPTLKVLFVSGYTDDALLKRGVMEAREALLAKPFLPRELAARVRQILDDQLPLDRPA
jgi:PAS domain S-box-containing protein